METKNGKKKSDHHQWPITCIFGNKLIQPQAKCLHISSHTLKLELN